MLSFRTDAAQELERRKVTDVRNYYLIPAGGSGRGILGRETVFWTTQNEEKSTVNVLNPALFEALKREFGEVRVGDRGTAMNGRHVRYPGGQVRLVTSTSGEYYKVCCPFCNDTRFRLWINHRWGVRDPVTESRHRWAAICYNEACLALEENRVALIKRTSWYHRSAGEGRVTIRPGQIVDHGRPKPLPADFVRLDALKRGHPARKYVKGRGFSPDKVAARWGVGYSADGPFPGRGVGRLVIPIYRVVDGTAEVWGWQARTLVDCDHLPKYFTVPDLKKSALLYGAERVKPGTGPVAVCEGPIDVGRFGKDAVALVGNHASDYQVRLLCRLAAGRRLVVALDGDARDEAETLAARLRECRRSSLLRPDAAPVSVLPLPAGVDPADCTSVQINALLEECAARSS